MGAFWALLSFTVLVISEMSDAYGLTVKAEVKKLAIKLVGLILIITMFWQKLFSLNNFFMYQFFILTITFGLLAWTIHHNVHRLMLDMWNLMFILVMYYVNMAVGNLQNLSLKMVVWLVQDLICIVQKYQRE